MACSDRKAKSVLQDNQHTGKHANTS